MSIFYQETVESFILALYISIINNGISCYNFKHLYIESKFRVHNELFTNAHLLH